MLKNKQNKKEKVLKAPQTEEKKCICQKFKEKKRKNVRKIRNKDK